MAALDSGPCEAWPIQDCPEWPDNLAGIKDTALMAATEILWNRTKRRFGLCTVTLRPCAEDCTPFGALAWLGSWLPTWNGVGGWGWPYPALVGGRWYNFGCGTCQGTCSCTVVHQVELPGAVASIDQVKLDGAVMAPTKYRVDDWRYLVRLDGFAWPRCNDLNLADTEVGTWSVTAKYGEEVPALGQLAVNELALNIAQAACGDGACNLSQSQVAQIQRQGVSKQFVQDMARGRGALNRGTLGLLLSDRFIETYNPTRAGVATVYNMDGRRPRRTGT